MTFELWRDRARQLLGAAVPPEQAHWETGAQPPLFDFAAAPHRTPRLHVPREFLDLAADVALHRDERKWALLYRALYRLVFEDRHLLRIASDEDVARLAAMRRQVSHDVHRMHAFVRFREHEGRFVAWYEPDHLIVERAAPWFAERFADMQWSILTPDHCAHWDLRQLTFTAGVGRSAAPGGDPLEDLWKSYYASTFNPARLNLDMMKSHMPTRKWSVLPEAEMIPALVHSAQARAVGMVQEQVAISAAAFIPPGATLPVLREAIHSCRGCDLYRCATQPVFGVGPERARIVMVGEQPGDNEDREGKPFVGPAGQLFDRALADAGLSREEIYLTGAVKHFRYEERGKRRIHKTASKAQVAACQPWLEAELALVKPKLIVCLGNTAALSVIGRGLRLLEERGRILPHRTAEGVMPTVHPSFILRIPDTARQSAEYEKLVIDLRVARDYAARV